jgi:hypothetical protein
MEDFYVTLVSSSSTAIYPQNECADFSTKLYKRLDLNDNWEVGMTEIFLPATICNIANGTSRFWIYFGDMLRHRIILTDMFVPSAIHLLEEINEHVKGLYEFTLDTDGLVVCTPNEEVYNIKIRFSPDLADMLGFRFIEESLMGTIKGYKASNILKGLSRQLRVCSNIVKEQVYGESTLKLLRCVSVDINPYIFESCMSYTFPNVMYIPLSLTDIEQISIYIKDKTGAPAAFTGGTSTVVLHFRQRLEQ